ncbi:hypothetical protein NH343_17880 [Cobetia sp. Dlab-2-U]|nr:hypothetical protein [Cobetia sp. Dlab-2-U]
MYATSQARNLTPYPHPHLNLRAKETIMPNFPKLVRGLVFATLWAATPGLAFAGTEFHIKNCSNHEFQLDIAVADWFKPADLHLDRHDSVTMHCMTSECNLGITWSGGTSDATSFEHLYTDLHHGSYVLYMKTGLSQGSSIPSRYCVKAFALRRGESCDIFDEDYSEIDTLRNIAAKMKSCS